MKAIVGLLIVIGLAMRGVAQTPSSMEGVIVRDERSSEEMAYANLPEDVRDCVEHSDAIEFAYHDLRDVTFHQLIGYLVRIIIGDTNLAMRTEEDIPVWWTMLDLPNETVRYGIPKDRSHFRMWIFLAYITHSRLGISDSRQFLLYRPESPPKEVSIEYSMIWVKDKHEKAQPSGGVYVLPAAGQNETHP